MVRRRDIDSMTATENLEFNKDEIKLFLDGTEISKEELDKRLREVEKDKSKRIVEVSPGNFKTLNRIFG